MIVNNTFINGKNSRQLTRIWNITEWSGNYFLLYKTISLFMVLSLHFILLQNLSLIMQHNVRPVNTQLLKPLKRNKPKNCADKKLYWLETMKVHFVYVYEQAINNISTWVICCCYNFGHRKYWYTMYIVYRIDVACYKWLTEHLSNLFQLNCNM